MKTRRNSGKSPAPSFSPIGALLSYVKVVALVLLLLVTTYFVAGMVKSASRPGGKGAQRSIQPVRLTAATIGEWTKGAAAIGASREAGKAGFEVESLALFLEWARNNFPALENSVGPVDADRFLGITASIERARRNFRRLAEFEMMASEEISAGEKFAAAAIIPAFAPAPAFEKWEEDDLRAYEESFSDIETALFGFIPRIGMPVPAWDERGAERSRDGVVGAGRQ